ncbi:tape measure protein [Pedobacter sp. SL55]|uniref:tape measure protein n=1 Tax=Pedobacter sp. SL55 TaxID=2995161 RepID=UPI00226FA78D|nr:tape measure protein [Pedobacter sp. SL55]WAC40585.1 tape measure protein [Pedobacter sp. SL55]
MSNLVEFVVKIKDLGSATLGKLASAGESSFARISNSLNRTNNNFQRLGGSIGTINRKLDDLKRTREISVDSRQIRRVNREMEQLERRRDRLENLGRSGGGGAFGMGGLVAGALAMAGVAGFGGVVNMGMEKTMTNTSYEVLAGKQQGQALAGNLTKYAQDTIYGNEVTDIGKTMLGFGIEAKNVMPAVQRLGDLAIGNAEKFKSLGLVYSQVAAQGKLMGQDNLQFINAGFNPLQELQRTTGRTMAKLKEDMEKGKISFSMVQQAIMSATSEGGRFYNMTNTLAETAPGKLLGLQGAFEGLMARVGASTLEAMVPLMDFGQWLIDSPALLNGLASAIAALTVGIGIWQVVTKWAAITQWALNIAVMWPVFLIAAIIGLIVALVSKYEGWGAAMKALWAVIKSFCMLAWIAFKNMFQEIGFRAELFWLKIKQTFQWVGGAIANLMNAMRLALSFKFAEAKQALFAEIKTKATAEIETLEKSRQQQRQSNLKEFADNLNSISKNSKLIKLTKKKDSGTASADGIGGLAGGLAGAASGAPSSMASSNNGISGGGVKNLTITVNKFFDELNIHAASASNGIDDMEQKIKEVFLRVVNSGVSAATE